MKKNINRLNVMAMGFVGLMAAAAPAYAQMPSSAMPVASMGALPNFEDLVEKLTPAVVNVSTTMKIEIPKGELPPMPRLPQGSPFEEFFKEFYDQYQNGTPQREQKANALGSGFVIDAANGYILTNNHVVKDADEIKIILNDNTTLDATLVGRDEKIDIAVLKVKPLKPLTAVTWGDSDKARVGGWVLAIGNPFGLGGTVTAGIISARHRDINAGPYDEFIQTDASINRGNSGGPMFDVNGRVIGVNTAIFSPSGGGSVGIGFAIPSNLVRSVADQLIKYGKTKRGWMGVKIQEVTPEIADSIGLDRARGAMVSSSTPKGPSEKAGIKSGDVILSFDGHAIDTLKNLPRLVAEAEVGKKSEVILWRNGKEVKVSVDLGQLEKAEEQNAVADKAAPLKKSEVKSMLIEDVGLNVANLTEPLRELYKIDAARNGVLVTEVKKDSAAAEKGFQAGDVIVELDQAEVTTADQVKDKIAAALKAKRSSVLFFVARGSDLRFIAVKIKK
jgi:serine protease Do